MIPPDRRRSISPCIKSSSSKLNLRDFVAIGLHSGRRLVNNDMLSMVAVDKAQGEVFEMMRSDFVPLPYQWLNICVASESYYLI